MAEYYCDNVINSSYQWTLYFRYDTQTKYFGANYECFHLLHDHHSYCSNVAGSFNRNAKRTFLNPVHFIVLYFSLFTNQNPIKLRINTSLFLFSYFYTYFPIVIILLIHSFVVLVNWAIKLILIAYIVPFISLYSIYCSLVSFGSVLLFLSIISIKKTE